MSNRRIYGEEESQEGAAGSEFGKKQREEARRKKYGIITKEFKVEDQPWILKVNGKAGRRYTLCLYLLHLSVYCCNDYIVVSLCLGLIIWA